MQLRLTTVNRFRYITGEHGVSGRIEISNGLQWLNLGIQPYRESDWLLMVALLVLGARAASVPVAHEDISK